LGAATDSSAAHERGGRGDEGRQARKEPMRGLQAGRRKGGSGAQAGSRLEAKTSSEWPWTGGAAKGLSEMKGKTGGNESVMVAAESARRTVCFQVARTNPCQLEAADVAAVAAAAGRL
jgi:hypothetical protein